MNKNKENERVKFDIDLSNSKNKQWIIGIDEVGYGCFAGSLVVGAVALNTEALLKERKRIFEEFPNLEKVKDSKKIIEKQRVLIDLDLRFMEKKEPWFYYSYGEASVKEINELGITKSHNLATSRALIELKNQSGLNKSDYLVIIDGNKVDECLRSENVISIIKADDKSFTVASASILAKQHRDRQISELSLAYPEYEWLKNKGYGTLNHRIALKRFGLTPHHRLKYCKNHI